MAMSLWFCKLLTPWRCHGGKRARTGPLKFRKERAPVWGGWRKQGTALTVKVWNTDHFQTIHSQPETHCHHSRMAKSLCSGVRQHGFKSCLHPSLAVWPWLNYLTSLCFKVLIFKPASFNTTFLMELF